jgi:Prenyltransferase and squalene oxidase repeat
MPDSLEHPARKNHARLVGARIALVLLVAMIAIPAVIGGVILLRERARIRQWAEDLVSKDPVRQNGAETLLLEMGEGAEEFLERAARLSSDPTKGACLRILEGIRRPGSGAVFRCLLWLARHQDADGSWNARAFSSNCTGAPCTGSGDEQFTAGVTGLSLLAFLGAGYSQLSHDIHDSGGRPAHLVHFGRVVRKALEWLKDHQAPDGSIGLGGTKGMYNHVIAAQALSEAYGMTASQPLKVPAQKAIDFLVASQTPGKGWRYSPQCGESDSSVTGWAVMALKSAELSELSFPNRAYDGALAWYEEVRDSARSHELGYTKKGADGVSGEGREGVDRHPTMEALGTLALIFMKKNKSERTLEPMTLVISDLPEWKANKIDFTYWHFGATATFQVDGPEGPIWTRWNNPLKDALLSHQKTTKDGCAMGSWDPEGDRWGSVGGRVYAVALNALTLEVYYRYLNVHGGAAPADQKR